MLNIVINVKLQYVELLKLRLKTAYSNTVILILTILGLNSLWNLISYYNGYKPEKEVVFIALKILFVISSVVVIPLSLFYSTKTDLKSNKFISQNVKYIFNEQEYSIIGETFSMQNKWIDLNKIVEYNNWFLLYTSKTQALFIPKNRFDSDEDIDRLKELIKTLNVTKKLK